MGNFNFHTVYQNIERLRHKVAAKIRQFQREYPDAKETYLAVNKI